jgi:hypothetical protein
MMIFLIQIRISLFPSAAELRRIQQSQANGGRENYLSEGFGKRVDPTGPAPVQPPVLLGFRMPYTEAFHVGFCPVAVGNKSAFLPPLNTMAPTIEQPIGAQPGLSIQRAGGDGFHE